MWVTIILNIVKKYWYVFIILGLAIALFLERSGKLKWKHKANTAQFTNEEILRKTDSEQKQIVLEKDTYIATLEKELQWALDSVKKKPKQITKVQYIKTTREVYDTTEITTVKYDTVYYNEAVYTDCGLSVKVRWEDSVMTWNVKDTTEFAIVTYKNKNWWNIFKKQGYTTQVVNKCSQEIVANESYSKLEKRK